MSSIEAPWSKAPRALLKDDQIKLADIKVYLALDYLCGKRGWWYGSHAAVADEAGVPVATLKRSVTKLREGGYISTHRLGIAYQTWLQYSVLARVKSAPTEPDKSDRSFLAEEPINPDFNPAEEAERVRSSAQSEFASVRTPKNTTDLNHRPSDDDPRSARGSFERLVAATHTLSPVAYPEAYWRKAMPLPEIGVTDIKDLVDLIEAGRTDSQRNLAPNLVMVLPSFLPLLDRAVKGLRLWTPDLKRKEQIMLQADSLTEVERAHPEEMATGRANALELIAKHEAEFTTAFFERKESLR